MKYSTTTRHERPAQEAIAYFIHSLIFILLACMSEEQWITLLCAFLSFIAVLKAINLLTNAMFYRDVLLKKKARI